MQTPSSNLASRLTLPRKFLGLGLMVAFLFALPTYLLIGRYAIQIDAQRNEAEGAQYLGPVLKFMQLLQQHRGLSSMVLNGSEETRPKWLAKRRELDELLAVIRAAGARHAGLKMDAPWRNIERQWQTLEEQVADLAPPESFQRHTDLITETIRLYDTVGDRAGIILDPTITGYYVGQATIRHLPMLSEYLGRMRAWGSGILARRQATGEDRLRFAAYMQLTRQEYTAFRLAMDKAFAETPELKASVEGLYGDLGKVEEALGVVEIAIVKPEVLGYDSAQYFNVLTRAIDPLFSLVYAVDEELIGLLIERGKRLERERNLLLGSTLALFAVIGLLSALFVRSLLRQLGGEPVWVADCVRRVAEGDLTLHIEIRKGDDSSLLHAVRQMLERLRHIIGEVRTAADELVNASGHISDTAQSLSLGASQQSAAVDDTSSALEQMTAAVYQNSENAKATNRMAVTAAEEACQGGQAVSQTVEAMQGIAAKIGVIDDIAYQTNLLALNAAIEAARAGVHGRTFGVVANEVRKLAERSRAAAGEISSLTGNSRMLAERAGALLESIVPAIRKTSELVGEIATASEEQETGVNHVNNAVMELSRAAQQSAAASEQLAATSEEMSAQAQQLQQLMGFFKLDGASERMRQGHGRK